MAPTKAQIDTILDKAKADIGALFSNPVATATSVKTGDLQAAIVNAQPGATLLLDAALVEPNPIILSKPLKLVGANVTVVDEKILLPSLRGGVELLAPDCGLTGIEAQKTQARNDIVVVMGDRAALSHVRVLGDPLKGQKRGIATNAKDCLLSGVYVDHIWASDQDTQAVCGWDNCINLMVVDSYLSAAGETFLIGGADPQSASRRPANVTVRRSTLTKRAEWMRPGVQVKNALELKNITGALIEDCTIEHSWQNAQDGYLIVLTPRNQDGTAPESNVEDVVIQRCKGGHAAALLNLSGTDDERLSQRMRNVRITDCTFTDINPSVYRAGADWGSDKLIQVGCGPLDVTIARNKVSGAKIGSALYFYGTPPAQNFVFTDNDLPMSTYGIMGEDSAPGLDSWHKFVASGTLSGNSIPVNQG